MAKILIQALRHGDKHSHLEAVVFDAEGVEVSRKHITSLSGEGFIGLAHLEVPDEGGMVQITEESDAPIRQL